MAKEKTALTVNHNTAVTVKGYLQNPCAGLIAADVPVGTYIFGFDPTIKENESLVFKVDDNADVEADDFIGKPFPLQTWACKRIEQSNAETGLIQPAIRVTLISDMNDVMSFVSNGVVLSLDLLRMVFGDGPYIPALPITVKVSKTNRGFRMYKIQPYYGQDDMVV